MARDKPNHEGETKIVDGKSGPLHYVAKVSPKTGKLVWRRAPSGNAKRRVTKYSGEERELMKEFRGLARENHVTLSREALGLLMQDAEARGMAAALSDERLAVGYDRLHRRKKTTGDDIRLTPGFSDYSRGDQYAEYLDAKAPRAAKKPTTERQKLGLRKGALMRKLKGSRTTQDQKMAIMADLDDINRQLGGQLGTGKKRQRTSYEEDNYDQDMFDPSSVFPF